VRARRATQQAAWWVPPPPLGSGRHRAWFRFYAELNDYLPDARRHRDGPYHFDVPGSVKDAIEAFGVPHVAVDLVLVNGRSVSFDYLVHPGDRVSVYPVFERLEIKGTTKVRADPLREIRFVADVHLGRLARYLRMAGFDTLYWRKAEDAYLAELASEGRILLTRDLGLLKRNAVTHGYWLRETSARAQLAEVLARFDLYDRVQPFRRCMRCNTPLEPIAREEVRGRVPEGVWECYKSFAWCPTCRRVYWKGSHYDRMRDMLRAAMEGHAGSADRDDVTTEAEEGA
jgi:uncharacterized protein